MPASDGVISLASLSATFPSPTTLSACSLLHPKPTPIIRVTSLPSHAPTPPFPLTHSSSNACTVSTTSGLPSPPPTTHIRHHAFNPHPFSSRSSPLSRYKPSLTALSCLLSKHGHRQSAFHPTSLAHTAFVAALPPTGHYMASLTMFALHMAVGVPLPRLTPTLAMMPPLNSSSKPSPALHHHPHRM